MQAAVQVEPSRLLYVLHAGLQFFPGFLNADRRAALDRAALAYQKWGRQQIKLKGVPGPSIEFFAQQPPLPALTELVEATAASPDAVSSSQIGADIIAASKEPPQANSGIFCPLEVLLEAS